jgi:hypothetical protein
VINSCAGIDFWAKYLNVSKEVSEITEFRARFAAKNWSIGQISAKISKKFIIISQILAKLKISVSVPHMLM